MDENEEMAMTFTRSDIPPAKRRGCGGFVVKYTNATATLKPNESAATSHADSLQLNPIHKRGIRIPRKDSFQKFSFSAIGYIVWKKLNSICIFKGMAKNIIESAGFRASRRKRWLRKIRTKAKKIRRNGGTRSYFGIDLDKTKPYFVTVRAPEEINIYSSGDRKDLLSIVKFIREAVLIRNHAVCIDFSLTKKLSAPATLFLLAELDRIVRLSGNNKLLGLKPSRDPIVCQVMHQVGFLDFFGSGYVPSVEPLDESVRHWRYATGVVAEGEKAGQLVEHYEGTLAEPLKQELYKGLTEAMTNTLHHACPENRRDGVKPSREKRWWMFSQLRDNDLTVAICDLGIGIPRSLPRSNTWDRAIVKGLVESFGLGRDSSIIRAAVELGKTRTGHAYRGKGLADIVDAARLNSKGGVSILSNKGAFGFNAETGKELFHDYRDSIMGTLIFWSIPVDIAKS